MWKRDRPDHSKSAARDFKPEQIELKGFNRTLAEIEWLLLVLILVYQFVPGVEVNALAVAVVASVFAALIIGFRYLNLFTTEARWKLMVETLGMIGLTAFVIWHTGKSESPLVNLYLLPIVFSALTLGKLVTLGVVALVTLLYLHASYSLLGDAFFAYATFSNVMFNFAPFVLVAYLTAMLAADMNFAQSFLRYLSETDELTGLPNMRAFYAAAERERVRAAREGTEFTLMMIDTDNLKRVNDRFGHEVGNHLIIRMVDTMRHTLRGSDMIARYGGDEFIMLLPATGKKAAKEVAERVRTAIAHMSFDASGQRVGTTVSIGLAVYPEAAEDVQQLVSKADLAMYHSKKAGRDRSTVYGDPEMTAAGLSVS